VPAIDSSIANGILSIDTTPAILTLQIKGTAYGFLLSPDILLFNEIG
jgi:hypothetical protein